MIEILWHGRGGQGAFTAARLLGAAASLDDGRHALAFPSFGPERRGAPMRAFTKLSDEPIGDRSAVAKADYVIYLDDTLLGEGWETELKPGGVVLVNSVRMFDDERIAALDADGISAAVLGRPIPNTVFLGALSALCDRVSVENVQEAIRQYMPAKLHAKNIAIVDAAREAMGEAQEPREEAPGHPERAQHEDEGSRATPAESASSLTARTGSLDDAVSPRPASRIPVLRSANLDPADFAHSTCFDAGYLTVKNAGWRNLRPVIDAASCTGCLQCYLHCPDGTVYKVPSACRPTERADAAEASGAEPCGSKSSSRPEGRHVGLSPQSSAPEASSLTLRTTGDRGFSCGNCSNCAGEFESMDVTDTALAVMRCVQELRGRFGKGMVVDVLRGSQNAKLLDMHLDEAACYDTVNAPAAQVKEVIELLAAGGYLLITEGTYPVVGLGPRAREAAEEGFSLSMKRVLRKPERTRSAAGGSHVFGSSGAPANDADPELFERLRTLRKRLADEAGKPPYIVFSDAALRDMCAKRPATDEEFLEVSGVGATKLARYGEAFLSEIAAFEQGLANGR